MEARFDFTEDDLIAFQRHWTDHPPRGDRRTKWFVLFGSLYLLSLGMILLIGMFFLPTADGRFPLPAFIVPIVLIVLPIYVYLFRHRMAARAIRATNRRPEFRKAFGTYQYRLTPEGMAATTPTTVSLTSWSGFLEIGVGPHHAFFYTNPRVAFVLPKRAFEDEEQFRGFVEMARLYGTVQWGMRHGNDRLGCSLEGPSHE